MPRIIVMADRPTDIVMLSERISFADLESEHFRAQLPERLSWAVGDAHAAEQADQDHQSLAEASAKDRGRSYAGAHPADDAVVLSAASPAVTAWLGGRAGLEPPRTLE